MKTMKKFASLALALVLALALAIPAMASSAPDTYSITIENTNSGHTYEAYQIFAGTLSEDGKTLSNVSWGSGVTLSDKLTYPANTTEKTAAEIAEYLSDQDNNGAAAAENFAKFLESNNYLGTVTGQASTQTDGKYVINNLPVGYYLVKDKSGSQTGQNDSYTDYIVQLVNNVKMAPKNTGTPTIDKTSDSKHYVNAAVGDVLPFQLKATLPSVVSEYETYKLVFTDTLTGLDVVTESGVPVLTFSVNGTQTTVPGTAYTVTYTNNVMTITINDVKGTPFNAGNNDVITIDYRATVNSSAIETKKTGNDVVLEFSNDPNHDTLGKTGDNEGGDPDPDVKVYSYKLNVTKVDGTADAAGDKAPLSGVEFKLYKEVTPEGATEAEKQYAVVENGVITSWTSDKETGTTLTTDKDGAIAVNGLGAATYYLEETKALDGYNALTEPVKITITATMDETTGALKTLASNTGNANASDQTVSATVENFTGATLPSTGGMGTTIFYVVGGVLVLGAAVLLITKKRTGSAN